MSFFFSAFLTLSLAEQFRAHNGAMSVAALLIEKTKTSLCSMPRIAAADFRHGPLGMLETGFQFYLPKLWFPKNGRFINTSKSFLSSYPRICFFFLFVFIPRFSWAIGEGQGEDTCRGLPMHISVPRFRFFLSRYFAFSVCLS